MNKKKSHSGFAAIGVLIILPLAIILDLVGIILFFFALDDFWITDAIGLFVIGGWMLLRKGEVTVTKKGKKIIKKVGRKVLKRFGLAFLIEIIPYLGVAPSWTIAVFFELKNN